MPEAGVVELHGVTKRFAGHTAVNDLSLTIPRGAIYGLLGPNGAGKSTTIRMIMSILLPDAGRIALFGGRQSGKDLSHRIGYLPEERGLYKKMRVVDLLVFLAEIKGVARGVARRSAHEWLGRLGLSDWELKRADDLSKGMQQKVQFIATVLHRPELLILDEPFSGLDPVNAQVMKDTVVELARAGTTILFSTHIMEQAEKLCDAVCIIARGTKVVDGPLAEVKRRHGGSHVVVAVERREGGADRVLGDRRLVARADDYGGYAELELATGADPQDVLSGLLQAGARVTRFEIAEATLHKIFIDMVGPDAAAARAVGDGAHA
ncbi:MAG: ATP-binding cassette domain-containing protein [Gemmatimonadota bacterium]|nr:ATP-binding cassette domain-containing protein [Gemmatimonadota bacterium]